MKYLVKLEYLVEQSAAVEVEADSEEEAIEKADELGPTQCEEVSRNLESSEAEGLS